MKVKIVRWRARWGRSVSAGASRSCSTRCSPPTRFSQFQKRLGIATNILAKRLEDLVASGIMEHRPGAAGEQAESFLMQKGLELKPVVVALTQWATSGCGLGRAGSRPSAEVNRWRPRMRFRRE